MEDNKENIPQTPSITKIYEPLKEFSILNLEKFFVHSLLKEFLLSEEQLIANKFPVNCCGEVVIPGLPSECFSKEGLVCRRCNRCSKTIHVSVNGNNASAEVCSYHPDRSKLPVTSIVVSAYKCCNKPRGSPGCKSHFGHVFAQPILKNSDFKIVREKKYVKRELRDGIYALDCEMVYTTLGLQLAKIGVVNHEGLTLYETFVLPENEIVDYNTTYSGITAKDLSGVSTTLADVQTFLDQLLDQNSILIGHGLDNDLKVLRLVHDKVIDTSVMLPRSDGSKQKLRDLSVKHLGRGIQNNPNGHDCIEDARTCMALVLQKLLTLNPYYSKNRKLGKKNIDLKTRVCNYVY